MYQRKRANSIIFNHAVVVVLYEIPYPDFIRGYKSFTPLGLNLYQDRRAQNYPQPRLYGGSVYASQNMFNPSMDSGLKVLVALIPALRAGLL